MNRPTISNTARIVCITTSIVVVAAVAVSITSGVSAQKADPAPGTPEFYTQKVEPILDDNCYSCHAEGQSGGLRLDSYKDILHGGGHGSPIVPGDPDTSLLIQAIRRTGKLKMPPKHPLEQAEIDTLTAWVKAGAKGTDVPAETLVKSDAPATTATQAQPTLTKVSAVTTPHAAGPMSDADFFENNVRPIFANNCSGCHVEATSGGLKLDSRESLLKGGEHGPAIVPGDPDKSLIITAVHQTTKLKMPKGGKLNPQEVADLTEWVKRGAVWPKSAPGTTFSASVKTGVITDRQRAFWAYQPLKVVAVPEPKLDAKDAHWARTPHRQIRPCKNARRRPQALRAPPIAAP